jgi:hypothetical protein
MWVISIAPRIGSSLIVSLAAIIDIIATFDIIVKNDGCQPMLTRDSSRGRALLDAAQQMLGGTELQRCRLLAIRLSRPASVGHLAALTSSSRALMGVY